MQSTSNQFKTAVKSSGRHFKSYVMINGTKYESIDGMEIKYGIIQGDDIGIGNCYISSLSITLKGVTTTPKFLGQKIIPYIGLQLDDTGTNFEYLKMGVFKVQTANVVDRSIVITANDNMQLANVGFFSNLKGNQKITAIMNEQCQKLGFSFVGGADDVAIDVSKLEGLKIIEAMSLMSAYCGKNAIANREGNIEFKWFNDVTYEIGPNRYPSPLTVGEKDFVVNGVSCVADKDTTLSSGLTTGKVISISNQFMTQARLDTIFNKMKSFTYRTCNLTYTMCDPSLEVGDIVTIKDVKGNKYKVPLFNFSVKFTGGCAGAIECFGKTDEQKSNQNGGFLSKKVERNYTEYISTKELLADTIVAYDGKFGKVETDYLQVNVEISALSGKFGTISSDLANFKVTNTEQLNAINAKINTLETVDLKAITATIAQANIDIGKINTLLAGTVTAGSGQYININAKNALFDNAFFKQLVATNVTAVDIFGERISTNQFKVGSDNGNLLITDNTIQIKDASRQRVQIGKDASGDYNIYVWDKLGKLMFDATGITADGIQKPIIRDDMVSANANISGDKLNITSVITKINANSTLIESSHVKYDGKSLDVAFNGLQTTVDGIQIGGRNLLLNSDFSFEKKHWNKFYPDIKKEGNDNYVTLPDVMWQLAQEIDVLSGDVLTISCYARKTGEATSDPNLSFKLDRTNQAESERITVDSVDWKRYVFQIKVKTTLRELLYVINRNNIPVDIKKIMCERSTKPSDWTSAPEDTDGQITTLTESIKSQSTQISVAQGQIGTLITDVSQSKSDIATVKGGLTTATGNISTLQSNYSTLNQTVSGLSATVGSHTSSITTLTGTANTALINANNANTKIDGLEIGGRNLFKGYGDEEIRLKDYNGVGSFSQFPNLTFDPAEYIGETFTVSFYAKSPNGNTSLRVYNTNNNPRYFYFINEIDASLGTTWKYYSYTFVNIDRGSSYAASNKLEIYAANKLGVLVKKIKIEKGTKASDWSPAPEDVDNRITTEIKTVTDKQASFDVLLTGITGRVSATESTVTTVTNTVNNNKANWDKAPTALANANTANTLANANKTNLANLTTTVTETKTTLATLKLDYEGFRTDVSETYTTKTEFDNLQIGGRNLLNGTKDFSKGLYNGAITAPDYKGFKVAYKQNTSATTSDVVRWDSIIDVKPSTEYVLSFYAKGSGSFYSFFYPDNVATGISSEGVSTIANDGVMTHKLTADWKKYWIKWITKSTATGLKNVIPMRLYPSATGYICGVKFEEGTKMSDWSPSPDDIDASIATVDGKFVNYSTTTQMNSAIEQTKNSITQSVASTYATQSALGGLTTRMATAEQKLTSTALITTFSTAINGGTALTTTKFTMDATGLHIKGGGFDISNNAGTKVLSADVNGNLTLNGEVNATAGMIAGWQIVGNIIGNVLVPNVADGQRTGMAPGINTRTWQMQPSDGLCFWAGAYWKNGHPDKGSVAISEAPFRVYADGRLYATNANISGTIIANNGTIGGFSINDTSLYRSQTFTYDFTTADLDRLRGIISGSITPTSADYARYDMSGDGYLSSQDYVVIKNLIEVYANKFSSTIKISNNNRDGLIHIRNDSLGSDILRVGMQSVKMRALNVDVAVSTKDLSATSAWLGTQYSTGGWIGFYDNPNGTRKGWIGHNGGPDFQFTNEAGGSFKFNNWIYAPGFYDNQAGGLCTAGRGIRFFRHVQEQKYIEIGTDVNGAFGIYYNVSDRKYKKDIQSTSVKSALGIINQLEHVQFNWIDGGSHVDIGYIANDVKDIMEGLTFNVKQPDGSDQYNINLTTFLPLVTKGMQELSKTVEAHEDRLANLEKENTFLKGKIACLQAQLDSYTNPIA